MQNARTIQRKTRNHQSRSCFRKNIARRATRPSRDRKMDPFSAAGCSTFLRQSERNPLFHPQKANRRAPSSRARDDAKRIFRFERRDVNKNAFTHRATRKRERLHVVLNATTRRVSSSAVLFFFSLSLLSAAQSFFSLSSSFSHKRDRRGLIAPQKIIKVPSSTFVRERERRMKKKINNVQRRREKKREKRDDERVCFGWWCEKEWIDKKNENVVLHLIMIRETFCTKIIYITL